MNPKEKAKQLVNKFMSATMTLVADYEWVEDINSAKQCALIAVNEILNVYELLDEDADIMFKTELNYWQETKQEIEKYER